VSIVRLGSAARGYDYKWQQYRATYLPEHPLCESCKAYGYITPSVVVDHIIPHKGDKALFDDPANHQALCKECHDRKTQRDGSRGSVKASRACDVNGVPLDPGNPWAAG